MSLEIKNLSLEYKGAKKALNSITLSATSGVIGLLGPNGAGKSSLMRILATISKPTSGQVTWRGQDIITHPNALRAELGYLPQYFGVYDQLSGAEFLHYLAGLKGLKHSLATQKIDKLLGDFNLSHVADVRLSQYSGGMRQRIGIAQALLNDPALLIVDEPTVGLDPQERANFRQMISDIASDRLVILSTHIVSDIETISDQIAIMNAGNLTTLATPQHLLQSLGNKCWKTTVSREHLTQLQKDVLISHTIRQGNDIIVHYVDEFGKFPTATIREPTLEDVYLYYVNCQPNSITPCDVTSEVA